MLKKIMKWHGKMFKECFQLKEGKVKKTELYTSKLCLFSIWIVLI